jgi:L-ribulose-5-phosphate 3-epimerase
MSQIHHRLATVSDEVAPGFAAAVKICLPLGIRAYEVRNLYGARVPRVAEEAIEEVLKQVREHDLILIGVSPGFCKRRLDDPAVEEEFKTGFAQAFRLMDRLGVRRMTAFSYRRTERKATIPPRAIDLLVRAVDLCRQEGVELLLENSSRCWADTGEHLAELARVLGIRVVWDPANAAAAGGQAYPAGYEALRDLVAHVHLKNWQPEHGWVYLNDGVVDVAGQLRALEADGYRGYYCIESHRWDDPEATETNVRQLLALLQQTSRGASIPPIHCDLRGGRNC